MQRQQEATPKASYPEMWDKTAILLYSLAKAHAWINGNKRMATMGTLLFLALNDLWWDVENEDLRAHVAFAAASDPRCFDETLAYFKKYFRNRLVPFAEAQARTQARVETERRASN